MTTKPRKANRRVSLRYRLFAQYFFDRTSKETFGNALRSALKAGFKESYAKQITAPTHRPDNARELFLNALQEAQVDDGKVAGVIRDGLEANRAISAISGKDANGGTVDFVDVPDHPTRLKAAKMVVDIKGVEAPKRLDARVTGTWEDLLSELDDEAGASETAAG